MTAATAPLPPADDLFTLADAALPGGGLGGYALSEDIRLIFAEGKGARFTDVRGREYIDYAGGAGALILGHSHPRVVAAMQAQVARGAHMFGVLSDIAVTLAQRLVADIPAAEKIAYATTGSEATAYAMRLARAHTGREKILKFEGAYHGNHDYTLVSTFAKPDGNYPHGIADTAGQPAAVRASMLIAPYNDLPAAQQIAEQHADDLAGIIVEPVQRIIRGEEAFLHGLRDLCDRTGAVLIFDEVVTGFRIAYGGAHAALGITPDLATFGKIIGGGGPLSCIAGKEAIINLANPAAKGQPHYTYFNGTLHGNPPAAAATLAMLDELSTPGTYARLEEATANFCREAQSILTQHNVPAIACHTGSLWQFLFMKNPPRNQQDMAAGDAAAMRKLDSEMMKRGNYMLPGVRRFVSTAHREEDFSDTLRALHEAAKAL